MSLRVVFMGSPEFAVPSLHAIRNAGHEVIAVYAQPPRPAGRGHKERPCPVHAYANKHLIPVFTPVNLRDEADRQAFAHLKPDIGVVAAYGLILPQAILDAPKFGCINVHASLLPRWRGAAPIHRALLAGDRITGVTIMRVVKALDAGPMVLTGTTPIHDTDTAESLHDRLSPLGAQLVVEALAGIQAGILPETPQPARGITYADKLQKDEGQMDWSLPAEDLARRVRGYTPWPSAWFTHGDKRIKVLAAAALEGSGRPGTVLDDQLTIATGHGALRLLKVQRAGKGPMEAEAFLRGYALPAGTQLS
ncbi:methionyl-tRNA formyltransferase [Magnetospira sp. QH-2]|uniref:methionyl-tRNA formyltransferase n=1 Tax=Magnetospira sp. (strain QH-2) TaxID=1288970 RepID=UPI0003E81B61|nr:methionyl-tRNA formyltransferase [Magnetospira sp. QH-2]CCQ72199.1 Methionyl-tRNA formyltransferase [Magnetospira sp. QH-2]